MCFKNTLKKVSNSFSLIELAVVLSIIGILIASIAGGNHLLKQARLNNIALEFNKYATAINNFRNIYKELPGDFSIANDYFSTSCSSAAFCNGDGNGQVTFSATTNDDESYRAWLHLSAADIIEQSFDGQHDSSVGANPGTNLPESSITNAAFVFTHSSPYKTLSGSTYTSQTTLFNSLNLATPNDNTTTAIKAALSPEDAKILDKKIDDAVANTGILMGVTPNTTTDASLACSNNSAIVGTAETSKGYLLTNKLAACMILYKINK
jgi:hypothetical protein